MKDKLSFVPVTKYRPGELFSLVFESYRGLIENFPLKNEDRYVEEWKRFEEDSFNNPNIGKCTFVTCLDGKPVGVASYDPRNFPKYGVIGQNCILPYYGGHGYGKKQILHLLEIFKTNHCLKAKVTTGDHPFFLPAQKMYLSCGFKEIGRRREEGKDFGEIDYEVVLK